MSEAQPLDPTVPDRDKEARIEQLLLSGLDHYFAGQYDQAINVWTRVVFLERGHDRARAYIERARGALAERHRESEELLHRGVAAFDRGDNAEARDLITRAVEHGGPHDLALVFLERLNRLGAASAAFDASHETPVERRSKARVTDGAEQYGWPVRVFAAVALIAAVFAGLLLGGVPLLEWVSGFPAGEPAQERVLSVQPEPIPVARSSELVLTRARSLQAGGHLYDALRMLEAVDVADPLRAEADRLRAEVQRQLLEVAGIAVTDSRTRP
jgi:tetratricopeptide (TPR) repeat protein